MPQSCPALQNFQVYEICRLMQPPDTAVPPPVLSSAAVPAAVARAALSLSKGQLALAFEC